MSNFEHLLLKSSSPAKSYKFRICVHFLFFHLRHRSADQRESSEHGLRDASIQESLLGHTRKETQHYR